MGCAQGIRVAAVSGLYETEPEGVVRQPCFMNAAVKIRTRLSPLKLLEICNRIEKKLGRKRVGKWGPRTIDLDVVLFGGRVIRSADLNVPHPLMHQRRFVLAPLAEIAKGAVHPVLRARISTLLSRLKSGKKVRKT